MKIKRIGSSSNRGYSSVELDKPTIRWDKIEKTIDVYQGSRKNFSGTSRHDYTVKISLSELSDLIAVIGGDSLVDISDEVALHLSPKLRELIRIQKACIGEVMSSGNELKHKETGS